MSPTHFLVAALFSPGGGGLIFLEPGRLFGVDPAHPHGYTPAHRRFNDQIAGDS